jgi:cupin fold WbuC family metalloprotein
VSLKQINDEVYYSEGGIVKISNHDIAFLIEKASINVRKRARICTHQSLSDTIHEMLIVHTNGNYIRPHKHKNKTESWNIIKGMADVVMFDETGKINEVISVGDMSSSEIFYYRTNSPIFHSMLIRSKHFVFHEITSGPFNKNDTIFAPWSPDENDSLKVDEFMKEFTKNINEFLTFNNNKKIAG